MTEPLRISFEVDCSTPHAFSTWTSKIAAWWPADHTASGERDATVMLEPGVGGRLYERTAAGVEHEWGTVTSWDPPKAFGYTWHLRRRADEATQVDIRFVDLGDGRTRVDIVHSGWERLPTDRETWRDRNFGGWSTLLPHFVAAVGRNH